MKFSNNSSQYTKGAGVLVGLAGIFSLEGVGHGQVVGFTIFLIICLKIPQHQKHFFLVKYILKNYTS